MAFARFARFAGLILLLSVALAACSITVTPTAPFPDAKDVTANNEFNNPIVSGRSLDGGESIVFKVDLSATSGKDMVIAELNKNLFLTVYASGGNPFASSSSPAGFAAGTTGLALASADASTAAIGLTPACGGSCVITDTLSRSMFVKVTNKGSSTQTFDLFVYGTAYADNGEPLNDTINGASSVSATQPESGAIETLGDVDFFRVTSVGTLRFNAASSTVLDLRATVEGAADSSVRDLLPGETYDVLVNDIIRVHVLGGTAAGIAGVSKYSLTIEP